MIHNGVGLGPRSDFKYKQQVLVVHECVGNKVDNDECIPTHQKKELVQTKICVWRNSREVREPVGF